MNPNKFTEKVQEALQSAQNLALRRSHQQMDVEHLVVTLLEQEDGLAGAILSKLGISSRSILAKLETELDKFPKVSGGGDQVYVSGRLNRLLATAEDEAKKLKDDFISIEHLLL
ncbi:MAG TPA: Clp protease N-terminal domain-containing protein, partial [Gemmatales bacterium]|nr:Clp protease N-terminal domain-containing protein [Gemmatales bacterium]